jgi:hypothetical protein
VDWSTGYDIVGAGGLTSSVDDMLKWDQNFYAKKLGKGTLLKEMLTPGVLNSGKQISYALGLEINSYRGLPVVSHDGAFYGYRTAILRFPDERFSVVCLCNVSSANTTELVRKVADIYLRDKLRTEPDADKGAEPDKFPDPASYAGRYLDATNHFVYSFAVSGNTLKAWGADLRRVGPNTFRDLGTGTITFTEANGMMHATLAMDGENFFAGDRVHAPQQSAADLSAYAGKYRSEEVEATYDLSVKDEGLQLKFKWDPAVKLDAVGPDELENGDLGNIVFRRDTAGRVTGFQIFTINARGVTFERVD